MADRHVLHGDLDWLEYAIADYIAKWGEHLTGRPYDGNIAGIPCATANMAMTVIRKNIVGSWDEPLDNGHAIAPPQEPGNGSTTTPGAPS